MHTKLHLEMGPSIGFLTQSFFALECEVTWALVSDKGGHGVVELEQGLHVDGQARLPVVGEGVQHQPGQGIVTFQHISATEESIVKLCLRVN